MSLLKGLLKESEDILCKQGELVSSFLGADLELDGSRRREISLYRNNEVVLAVEHGVTLGLLKLIYSSDSKFHGVLQGVRSRSASDPSAVSTVILSDDRVLDGDEYDLIIQDSNIDANFLQMRNTSALPPLATSISNSIFMNNNANNGNEKKKGQFVCEFCHLPFVSKAKFHRHRRIHTEENPYVCVYCSETFPHHLDLRKHREEHHMLDKPFKCSYCPKTFSTRAELRGHLWRHTGEKNHKCRICLKTFATKGNLKLHIDKHIGVHKHKCPFCPQRFTSHSSLEAHMAKHTGLKAYKCRYCTKSYAQAGQLTSHERLHTGEKPFVCEVCSKGFRLNSTRLAHEKRHSGARPHICDTCGRSFAMPDHLRRHMKTHENKLDRVVACPFCKKKIFQGRNMRKHLFRHRELNLTEMQAKMISASLKPDWQENEKDQLDEEQRSQGFGGAGKRILQCQRCNEEVKSIRKLFKHLSEVHYQRELTAAERKEIRLQYGVQKLHHCQFCLAYFMDYRLLRSHVLSEHPENSEDVGFTAKSAKRNNALHKCPNCLKDFELRSVLDEHIIKDHLTTSVSTSQNSEHVLQFRCWYCQDNFHSPEEVVTHMTNQHESLDVLSKRVEETVSDNNVSSTGLWACPHCPVNVKTESEYNTHIAQHSQTNDSSDKAEESSAIAQPMETSCTIASSWVCPHCHINLKNESDYNEHILLHSQTKDSLGKGEQPCPVAQPKEDSCTVAGLWVCPHCPVNVKTENEYNMHVALHSQANNSSEKVDEPCDVAQSMVESCTMSGLWICPHCHVNLKNENEYNSHVVLHTQTKDSSGERDESCDVIQPMEDSYTMNDNPPCSSSEDVSSYLNSIHENESENWTECVVQKYLKTDPLVTNKTPDTPGTSEIYEVNCRNTFSTDSLIGSTTSLNDSTSVSSIPPIGATSSTKFVNASMDITYTGYMQNVSHEAIGSTTDVSSTTQSNAESSYISVNVTESVTQDSAISYVTTTSEINSKHSGTSLLNTPTDRIKYNKKPLPIILPNNMAGQDEVRTSPSSVHFNVGNSIKDAGGIVGKDNLGFNAGCQVISKIPLIHTDMSSKICTISTNSDNNASEKCKKTRKKKKNKDKKIPKYNTKIEIPKLKFGTSTSGRNNNTCLLMESCRFCSDVFKNKTELNNHVKVAHPNEDGGSIPFRCWFCTATFTTPEDVVVHMTNTHDNLDNLSRCIEVTELKNQIAAENESSELKNQIAAENESCRLKLLKLDDTSLSPVDSLKCPKCQKKLESKEAYELHMIVHEASNDSILLTTGTGLSENHCTDRNTSNTHSSVMEEVSVTDEVGIDNPAEDNFTNETLDLSKQSVMPSCVVAESFTTISKNPDTVSKVASENSPILSTIIGINENSMVVSTMSEIDDTLVPTPGTEKTDLLGQPVDVVLPIKEIPNEKTDGVDKLQCQRAKRRHELKQSSIKLLKPSVLDHEYNKTIHVNMCTHCSRVFCTKRALDVHTFKMHGKEYLQKNQVRSTTPFNCWFCSAHYTSPEQVVEHMTSAHENLDLLSKRVEEQGIPASRSNTIVHGKLGVHVRTTAQSSSTSTNKYVTIAPQKQVIPLVGQQKQVIPIGQQKQKVIPIMPQKQIASTEQLNSYPPTTTDNNRQPPPGFKMSYALAYVPIYIPERNEKVSPVEKKQ